MYISFLDKSIDGEVYFEGLAHSIYIVKSAININSTNLFYIYLVFRSLILLRYVFMVSPSFLSFGKMKISIFYLD